MAPLSGDVLCLYLQKPLSLAGFLLLVGIGVATLTAFLVRVLTFVWQQYVRPGKSLKRYGEWALITGGTDGIGKAYSEALAKQGLKILLVSRTESKLQECCKELKDKYNATAEYVVADLSKLDAALWSRLKQAIDARNIGLLINNAGMSYDHYEYFDQIDDATIQQLIDINVVALTKMCHMVLPSMVARRRGCIVNISSGVSAYLPACPLLAVYAGSKSYVDCFSKALTAEYKSKGIDVQVQPPLFVASKMSKIRRATLTAPSPRAWVRSALRHIGYESQALCYPVHAVMIGLSRCLPQSVLISEWYKMGLGLRSKALKRAAAAAKTD